MDSIWPKTAEKPHFDTLDGKKSTDTLILGGGIAGILIAYKLKAVGVDCLPAEATEICGGITKNTTAMLTFCHGSRFTEDGELIDNPATDDKKIK